MHSHDREIVTDESHGLTKYFHTTIKITYILLPALIEMISGILLPTYFNMAHIDSNFTQMMIFSNSLLRMAVWTSTTATVPFADKPTEN